MYAVVRTGGKQYRVEAGDVIKVEKLAGEAGEVLDLADVLMLGGDGVDGGPKVGTPVVDGAAVKAEVLEQMKGPKVVIFKKKRRKNHRRKRGHRQPLTVLRIQDISVA
ncbi:MAG: 50S ribosomal protein L21 [Geminicoccaceae bacterium]|nr:50S ribosomal protein L21 [Geminicoccaceae bacterium]